MTSVSVPRAGHSSDFPSKAAMPGSLMLSSSPSQKLEPPWNVPHLLYMNNLSLSPKPWTSLSSSLSPDGPLRQPQTLRWEVPAHQLCLLLHSPCDSLNTQFAAIPFPSKEKISDAGLISDLLSRLCGLRFSSSLLLPSVKFCTTWSSFQHQWAHDISNLELLIHFFP